MSAKTLYDEMPFGKHRGKLIIDLIENNTEYVAWLIRETDLELDNEAYARYRSVAEEKDLEI